MKHFSSDMHQLARLFMAQFPELTPMSLDEFLYEYHDQLTDEQYKVGYHILEMFNYVDVFEKSKI